MGKIPLYRNGEGYADKTAGAALYVAVRDEQRKERKNTMAKRSCRRTKDESRIHEKAVKMRKMTDEQLVNYVENRVAKAKSEGFNMGKLQAPVVSKINIKDVVEEIGRIKGIGETKLNEIRSVLEQRLEGA